MRCAFLLAACLTGGATVAADPPTDPNAAPSRTVAAPPESQTPVGALVQLKPTQGNTVAGTLSLNTDKSGVRIAGTIEGFKPGAEQAFHVHEKGDCSAPDASSAGEHFNPTGQPHGNPKAGGPRHLGDMVNLRADAQGVAKLELVIDGATLHTSQPTDLVGKAIVVHQKADDYTSQPGGNAGDRVACGVIASR